MKRKTFCIFPKDISRWLAIALLALIAAACASLGSEAAPRTKIFTSPVKEISTWVRLPFEQTDHFGAAVDIEGDAAVAGAPNWGYPGEGAGAAYVFRRSGEGEWKLEAELSSSDRDDGFQYDQHFGEAAALQGTVIAIGAPGYDDPQGGDNTGAVYIFEHDGMTWVETARLTPARQTPGARMGSVIAFNGELLVMSGSPYSGSVATFQREKSGWRELESLAIPPSAEGELPYVLLDLYGDTLAVSTVIWPEPAQGMDEQTMIQLLRRTGKVTVYEQAGERWEQTFESEPQEASLYRMRDAAPFGLPVALGGEEGEARWLAVGKPGFTGSGREQGSVMLFEHGSRGWKQHSELRLGEAEPAEGALPFFGENPGTVFFGGYVGFEGNRLSVIATFANAVYVFERQNDGWSFLARVTPGQDGFDDFMRRTTAISGSTLLLGSPGDLGGGNVYVFDLQP